LWAGQAQALVDGISLMQGCSLARCQSEDGIQWRHRFLRAPKAMKALKVQGTVEADKTFFRRSFKGCRKLFRKLHKRGGHGAKPAPAIKTFATKRMSLRRTTTVVEKRGRR
jgi:hypothetical protein